MKNLKDQLIRLGSTNPELRPHLRPVLDRISSEKIINYKVLDKLKDVDTGSQQAFTNLRSHAEKFAETEEDRELRLLGNTIEEATHHFVEMVHISHDLEQEAMELENRFKKGLARVEKIADHIKSTFKEAKKPLQARLEEYNEMLDDKGFWTREQEDAAKSLNQVLHFMEKTKL